MGIIFSLLRGVPIWGYAIAAVFLWGAYGHWEAQRYDNARKDAAIEAQRMQIKIETQKQVAAEKVDAAYAQKLKVASISVNKYRATNAELQQLLTNNSSTAKDATTICGVDGERGRSLESLLAESGNLAAEGIERIEALTAKVGGLQDYISSVCLSK